MYFAVYNRSAVWQNEGSLQKNLRSPKKAVPRSKRVDIALTRYDTIPYSTHDSTTAIENPPTHTSTTGKINRSKCKQNITPSFLWRHGTDIAHSSTPAVVHCNLMKINTCASQSVPADWQWPSWRDRDRPPLTEWRASRGLVPGWPPCGRPA